MTITATLIARQTDELGEFSLGVVLGVDDPISKLNESDIDPEEFRDAVFMAADEEDVASRLDASEVPPPRDEADFDHVAVIGEIELVENGLGDLFGNGSDVTDLSNYDVELDLYDEFETEFIGKEKVEV